MPTEAELVWHEYGAGPTLVLCHGYTGSSLDFVLQVDALAEETHRRVVTLDLRGHGQSPQYGDLESYSIQLLADDLIALLDKVGNGPVDLLGHSMGGQVALHTVLQRPDLINSLILMDTSAWSFKQPDEGIAAMVAKAIEKFDPAKGMPKSMAFESPETALIAAHVPTEWQEEKDASVAGMDPYAAKALGMELLSDGVTSIRPRLSEIAHTTTVLVGQNDHPLVDQAPDLTAELPNATLTVIEGAYHSPQLTHPDQWRAAIVEHLHLKGTTTE
jgi:2-succinyl-6-hydroxy-2,4-cyclohexadiene-1-carboxylate synthase